MHPQQYPPQQQPGYNYSVNKQCKFTCCYCCSCTYDAQCVHKAAFIFDIILFGLWTINGLANIGTYGALSALYILLVVVFVVQVVLAIIHLCKYQGYIQSSILRQKVTYYLKVRMWMCVYMIIVGLLVGIVYLFVLRDYLIKNRTINPRTNAPFTDDEATSFGISALVSVIVPLLINVAVLYGYKRSFDDSTNILAASEAGGALGGVTAVGGPSGQMHGGGYQGGALGPAMPMNPSYNYQGAPPMPIGGNAPNPYSPQFSPVQPSAYNGPAYQAPLPAGFEASAVPQKDRPTVNYK